MSNFKVRGTITKIGEKKTLTNGVALDYLVEATEENGFKTLYNFGMYKKTEYSEHVDNFIKYNKVGDNVEVEFTIRGQEYNGKIYNNLSHWKCEKLEEAKPTGMAMQSSSEKMTDLPF